MADELNQPGAGAEQAPVTPGWEIEATIKHWKMKDRRAFVKLINTSKTSTDPNDDESILYPYLAKMVKAWPFPLDPSDPASYDELESCQFDEVINQIMAAFPGKPKQP